MTKYPGMCYINVNSLTCNYTFLCLAWRENPRYHPLPMNPWFTILYTVYMCWRADLVRSLQVYLLLRWEQPRRKLHIHVLTVRRRGHLQLALLHYPLSSVSVLLQRGVRWGGEEGGRGREGVGGGGHVKRDRGWG